IPIRSARQVSVSASSLREGGGPHRFGWYPTDRGSLRCFRSRRPWSIDPLPAVPVGLESAPAAASSTTNPRGSAMSDHRTQEFQGNGVGRRRGVRLLPALGAGLTVGLLLYASRPAGRPEAGVTRAAQAGADARGDDKT